MLLLVIRKMLNNKWLIACLLIGSVLTAAMVSSIPMYTKGMLQRLLTKDLENSQKKSGYYPGFYQIKTNLVNVSNEKERAGAFRYFHKKITEEMFKNINIPALTHSFNVNMDLALLLPQEDTEKEPRKKIIRLDALSDIDRHIDMVAGRAFSGSKADGAYEVIITQEAMKELDLVLDKTYTLIDFMEDNPVAFKVKVVGVFTLGDPADLYWNQGIGAYKSSLIMDYSLFEEEFVKTNSPLLAGAVWYYALDYHKITLDNLKQIISAFEVQDKEFKNLRGLAELKMVCIDILDEYHEREKQLKTTLWILQVPILIILGFYIFMVSQLIIDHEKNEIAVLKSRGASRLQIFVMYWIESLILAGITLLAGPPIGLFLCSIMGASNGFLEFVQRAALRISLDGTTYLYALLAVLFFLCTMLVPVLLSSRATIVQHKQSKGRARKGSVWQKYFLDIVLLGTAAYGFYRYNMQKKTLLLSGVKGTELAIDPLLFLTSTFFILGAGLLFLRVYPYIVRFIFWLGRKVWSPVLYASFIHVGRSSGQEQFLMLFLIFTLSVGIFSANAARTINRNMQDKILYQTGADIAIRAHWDSDASSALPSESESEMPVFSTSSDTVHYIEPYFMPYTQLPGADTATKVFRKNNVIASMPTAKGKVSSVGNVNLMGMIPGEFGKVAWFRPDLLPYHWYQYLNLMTKDRTAFLLSSSFQKKFELKEGDPISITWSGQSSLNGVIYAFIDYWPAFNPNARKEGDKTQVQDFIVANLQYIHDEMALEPYEVWIKKKPGVTSAQLYKDMEQKGLVNNDEIKDAALDTVEMKNDPMLQGTNGSLTLGFIVVIAVSSIGFLIYWILSIQSRLLQFGIFRAMGMTLRDVIGMLVCEQVLISGSAVFMGIAIGKLTSSLFVRLFEIVYSAEQQLLPFKVVEYGGDYLRLYMVVACMLVTGFAVLGTIISRIKINQVIKLGED